MICCLALAYALLSGLLLTAEAEIRMRRGERDALLYYVLQARRFTPQPPIDPVIAARNYAEDASPSPEVQARFSDFARACRKGGGDERLAYFCEISHNGADVPGAYPEAIGFIHEKEFDSRTRQGDQRRAFVASLYQRRGLSTDSSFDANFPVFLALRSLAATPGLRLNRVLIVGPGLDFAPRTQLDDSIPPQSIQPFAVADALLQLRVSTPDRLRIQCVDINPRVIEYFRSQTPRSLAILQRPGTDEYRNYFQNFGRAIGKVRMNGSTKVVDVAPEFSSTVQAERLNIVTERLGGVEPYDLVIATNVLVYLGRQELRLAFANIGLVLRDGGYFIHNELRDDVEEIGAAAGMPVTDARRVRLFEDDRRAIFDGQVIHRKGSQK